MMQQANMITFNLIIMFHIYKLQVLYQKVINIQSTEKQKSWIMHYVLV